MQLGLAFIVRLRFLIKGFLTADDGDNIQKIQLQRTTLRKSSCKGQHSENPAAKDNTQKIQLQTTREP